MKILYLSKFRFALLFVAAALPVLAQTAGYYRVEFIKTKPGKAEEYREFIKKNVPAIAKASIKAGKQMGWGMARVFTPTGTSVNHDLMGFYAFEKWEQMEPVEPTPDYALAAMKSLGFGSMADFSAKRDPLRDIVRTEIWKRQAGTTVSPDNAPKPGEVLVINFVKTHPGKSASYDEIWKAFSLPMQEERVKAGGLKSYTMYSVVGAGELGSPYDRVSIVRYASFKDVPSGPDAGNTAVATALSDKVHPGKDWRQLRRDMQALRSSYRSEILTITESIR